MLKWAEIISVWFLFILRLFGKSVHPKSHNDRAKCFIEMLVWNALWICRMADIKLFNFNICFDYIVKVSVCFSKIVIRWKWNNWSSQHLLDGLWFCHRYKFCVCCCVSLFCCCLCGCFFIDHQIEYKIQWKPNMWWPVSMNPNDALNLPFFSTSSSRFIIGNSSFAYQI